MALIKLVDSASFFENDEPTISIIDFDSTKGMLKQASDSRVQEFVTNIKPEKNNIYVHILAMGAGEYFGANRNADYFPEHNLIDCHKTFETSPAHIFRNHVNKNPAIAIGVVLFSIYNERMHRVEIVASIDRTKAPDVVARIENGEFPATSMACKTPYDVCSICGNKASTRQQYCEHLRTQLGKVYPDGRKVMALNVAPLKFFDMSIVVRPADVTSSVLQKVASEDFTPTEQVVGSAEHAEAEGLLEEGVTKEAAIQKLSEFIKQIEGGPVVAHSDTLDGLLRNARDPELSIISALSHFKLPEVLTTMAHLGISPSIAFLGELIARKMLGESAEGIGSLVASVVDQIGPANMELPKDEPVGANTNYAVATVLTPHVPNSSLLPEFVEKRAAYGYGVGYGHSNVGYMDNGPHIEPTAYERFRAQHLNEPDDKHNLIKMLHTLMTIGSAALAAKWYITRTIEQKMKENAAANNTGVKIILVKSASDYQLTYKLAKAAMVNVLRSK